MSDLNINFLKMLLIHDYLTFLHWIQKIFLIQLIFHIFHSKIFSNFIKIEKKTSNRDIYDKNRNNLHFCERR